LVTRLFSLAGEYSAEDAWEFKELEEAITKNYF
jgi:tRNA pseudouridine55 synthase